MNFTKAVSLYDSMARLMATPLFLVLLVIETTDLVFAVDSIPAILAITRDSFIVYTSNVFAILGLRSFYFALAGMFDKFRFLKVGLAIVLTYVGLQDAAFEYLQNPDYSFADLHRADDWAVDTDFVSQAGEGQVSNVTSFVSNSSDQRVTSIAFEKAAPRIRYTPLMDPSPV